MEGVYSATKYGTICDCEMVVPLLGCMVSQLKRCLYTGSQCGLFASVTLSHIAMHSMFGKTSPDRLDRPIHVHRNIEQGDPGWDSLTCQTRWDLVLAY